MRNASRACFMAARKSLIGAGRGRCSTETRWRCRAVTRSIRPFSLCTCRMGEITHLARLRDIYRFHLVYYSYNQMIKKMNTHLLTCAVELLLEVALAPQQQPAPVAGAAGWREGGRSEGSRRPTRQHRRLQQAQVKVVQSEREEWKA